MSPAVASVKVKRRVQVTGLNMAGTGYPTGASSHEKADLAPMMTTPQPPRMVNTSCGEEAGTSVRRAGRNPSSS